MMITVLLILFCCLLNAGELHQVIVEGNVERAKEMIRQKGYDLEEKDENGDTVLLLAAREGQEEIIRLLLSAGASVGARTNQGWSAVHEAARAGNREIFVMLVESGMDPKEKTFRQVSTLHFAAWGGNTELVKELLDLGMDITAVNDMGSTPLHFAALGGHPETAELLISRGAPLEIHDNRNDFTPVFWSAYTGCTEVVRILVKHGARTDLRDMHRGYSPLRWALVRGHTETAEYLLDGADLSQKDQQGNSLLHSAAFGGHGTIVRRLLDAGIDPEVKNNDGYVPLNSAALGGHPDVFRMLLDAGADIHYRPVDNSTVLQSAATGGNLEILEVCIKAGLDPAHHDIDLATPLHSACQQDQIDVVRFFLEKGCDPNLEDTRFGMTPFMYAARAGSPEILTLLIEHGAAFDRPNEKKGQTPLLMAVIAANEGNVRFLLERGADPNHADHNAETVLAHAAAAGNPVMTALLLEYDASPNLARVTGDQSCPGTFRSPMNNACWGGETIVRLMLEHGGDVNAPDPTGRTALFNAALARDERVLPLILEQSANPDTADKYGLTALDIAIKHGKTDSACMLLDHGSANSPARNERGWKPLHQAAASGDITVIEKLLERGDNREAKDRHGRRPYDLARLYGHDNAANLLVTYGTRPGFETPVSLLDTSPEKGEAFIAYLLHSGYAIRTAHHLLIFDYAPFGQDPVTPSMDNGCIIPEEIKDMNVVVFASHTHGDHWRESTLQWRKKIPDIRYVLGFPYPETDRVINCEAGNRVEFDGITVDALASTDTGAGFLVRTDGLKIYHAGDHALWSEDVRDDFESEVTRFAGIEDRVDIAFLPVSGCQADDPALLVEGGKFAIDKLHPRVVFPMHAGNNEERLVWFRESLQDSDVSILTPWQRGDRYRFAGGMAESVR